MQAHDFALEFGTLACIFGLRGGEFGVDIPELVILLVASGIWIAVVMQYQVIDGLGAICVQQMNSQLQQEDDKQDGRHGEQAGGVYELAQTPLSRRCS